MNIDNLINFSCVVALVVVIVDFLIIGQFTSTDSPSLFNNTSPFKYHSHYNSHCSSSTLAWSNVIGSLTKHNERTINVVQGPENELDWTHKYSRRTYVNAFPICRHRFDHCCVNSARSNTLWPRSASAKLMNNNNRAGGIAYKTVSDRYASRISSGGWPCVECQKRTAPVNQ